MSVRILVVDDEPDIPELFRQRLRREVRRGQEGLALLQGSELPESMVVLSDISMPVMDGLALLEQVKLSWPGLRMIMVSAYSDQENRDRAVALGADDFIAKPVDFQQLRDLTGNGPAPAATQRG